MKNWGLLLLAFTIFVGDTDLFAQGTAFTYQGQLQDSGGPANGNYDFTFTLFNNNGTSSGQIGTPVTNLNTPVSNGVFTVTLNFGSVFTNYATWLSIGVRTNGGATYTSLSPLQALTPTPYALFAESANAAGLSGTISTANIASGSITSSLLAPGAVGSAQIASGIGLWSQSGNNISYSAGNVGVGTTTPGSALQVNGTVAALAFSGNGNGLTNIPASAVLTAPPGMVLIPAGTFTIGDTVDGESDAVPASVNVSAFYMDVNVVSLSEWLSVYYWATNNGYQFDDRGLGKAANHPVQTLNWYDVVKWCNARSEQSGRTPVYFTDATQATVYRTGDIDLTNGCVNWTGVGYRLPTEAEWEKAARGGLSGLRFPWGNVISENLANYYGQTSLYSYDLGPTGYNTAFTNGSVPYTSPVAYFAPNGYGLYDMAGNVLEWCWDWYAATPYPTGSPYLGGTDPHGPLSGLARVLRGGYWDSYPFACRVPYRFEAIPGSTPNSSMGFRTVLP